MKRIAVYCGSNPGVHPAYAEAAAQPGAALEHGKIELVYGGGMVNDHFITCFRHRELS